jgi:hypothetical protein
VKSLLGVVALFASSNTALANHPAVEPWMHATNFTLAVMLGVSAAVAFRKRVPRLVSGLIGVCIFLFSALGGFFLCIVASM